MKRYFCPAKCVNSMLGFGPELMDVEDISHTVDEEGVSGPQQVQYLNLYRHTCPVCKRSWEVHGERFTQI